MSHPPVPAKPGLLEIFQKTKYLSVKHTSYFQVYEEVLARFVGKPITFVEVGVFNGGSLFMWREYLGPQARIIGIDMNPDAQRWREHGFEIFIGDQSDPDFWDRFYAEVGNVDVLLDDGGHMNQQQIVTAHKALDRINDGGCLIVEDVHTSYLPEFGNPSDNSFISFAKRVIDSMGARFPSIKVVGNEYWKKVFSMTFYESIVVFNVDTRRCFISAWASNNGIMTHSDDFRHASPIKTVLF
jgi:hypothetical protein